jgi:hypothetical protein
MSRSISPSAFFAEARSKIAPDAGEAGAKLGDFGEGAFVHIVLSKDEVRSSRCE